MNGRYFARNIVNKRHIAVGGALAGPIALNGMGLWNGTAFD
jgi:hypothetical protein